MKVLARLSFPSSHRLDDRIEHLPKRRRIITVRDSDTLTEEIFAFSQVYALTITYHHACSADMCDAYDQLLEFDDSPWLREIQERVSRASGPTVQLRHYRIYLDDGPCYDVLATGHEHHTKTGEPAAPAQRP